MQHPTPINSLYTYLSFGIYRLFPPPATLKRWDKNIPLLFRTGSGAQSGTLTDVSIMVIAKSCLYQTQHSGLTITANGHICHATKMDVCVCVCSAWCVIHLTKQKAMWYLLAELKIVFYWQGKSTQSINELMGLEDDGFRVPPLIE